MARLKSSIASNVLGVIVQARCLAYNKVIIIKSAGSVRSMRGLLQFVGESGFSGEASLIFFSS